MMANIAVKVELTDEERKELESLGRSRKTAQALARRAVAAEGLTNKEAKPRRRWASGAAALRSAVSTAFATNLVRVRRGATTTLPT